MTDVKDIAARYKVPNLDNSKRNEWLANSKLGVSASASSDLNKWLSHSKFGASASAIADLNKWLSRSTSYRLPAEMIRDNALAASGLLVRKIGGPSVKPYQPPGLWEETNAGENRGVLTKYIPDEGEKLYRRSLYTFWKRTLPPASMTIFDAPTRDFCEVRRQKTNTPLQALALQNDVQVLEEARVLAQNTLTAETKEDLVVESIFKRILVREPKVAEKKMLQDYYADALDRYTKNTEEAKSLVAVGEYEQLDVNPSKTAALMLTAQVIYNLDETITKE